VCRFQSQTGQDRELTHTPGVASCDMRNRRRILLGIGAVLLLTAFLGWRSKKRRTDASVELIFIGYTNKAVEVISSRGESRTLYRCVPQLRATNTGVVAIQLFAPVVIQIKVGRPGFQPSSPSELRQVLKPGDTVTIEGVSDNYDDPWWTEVSYQRYGLAERVYYWAWGYGKLHVKTNRH